MTKEQNIRAILDSCFAESKDELKEIAVKNIMELSDWIPLTTRPMTEDEKQHYIDIEKPEVAEYGEILACPLPDDGQEVLVSEGGIVCIDTFYHDDDCYFENADIDDVDAWQPLPKTFEKEDEYIFCNECEEHYTCSDAGGRDGCEFGMRSFDNVTNGDIIKATFPDCRVVGNHNKYEINNGINETASYIIVRFGHTEVEFNAAWWGS